MPFQLNPTSWKSQEKPFFLQSQKSVPLRKVQKIARPQN